MERPREAGARPTCRISYQDNNPGGLLTAVQTGNMRRARAEENEDRRSLEAGDTESSWGLDMKTD